MLSQGVLLAAAVFLVVPCPGSTRGPVDGGVAVDVAPDVSGPWSPCPTATCRVLTVGDSITAGYPDVEAGGYRVPLLRRVVESGRQPVEFVGSYGPVGATTVDGVAYSGYHDGFNGYVIGPSSTPPYGVADYFPEHLATYQPQIVLLHLGTNDLEQRLPAPEVRIGALVDVILAGAPDALLVVAQVIPQAVDDGTHPAYNRDGETAAYNAAIREIVADRATRGAHIATVDMNGAFRATPDYGSLLADGLHPTTAGYAVMADTWFGALSTVLH